MKISNQGIKLIKSFEGLRLKAYKDIAGIWTIGYGSTRYQNGTTIKPGDVLSCETEANTLFAITLNKYVSAVNKGIKVALTQNQFDALVSFIYNVGTGVVTFSTLFKMLNTGNYQGAADQFLLWNKITDPQTGKKILSKTLTNRREQERTLFLTA
jgi:lysozyme